MDKDAIKTAKRPPGLSTFLISVFDRFRPGQGRLALEITSSEVISIEESSTEENVNFNGENLFF